MGLRWPTCVSLGLAALGGLLLLRAQRRSLSRLHRRLRTLDIRSVSDVRAGRVVEGEEFVVCGRLATSSFPGLLGLQRKPVTPAYRTLNAHYGFGQEEPWSHSVAVTEPRFYLLQDFARPSEEVFLGGEAAERLFAVAAQTLRAVRADEQAPLPRVLKGIANFVLFALGQLCSLRLSGFRVGVVEREFEVALQSPLYMLVTAHFVKLVNVPVLLPSGFVHHSLDGLRAEVGRLLAANTAGVGACSAVLLALGWYALRRARRSLAARGVTRRLEDELRREEGLLGATAEGLRCVICASFPKGVILLPCNHCSLCRLCFHEYSRLRGKNACPICKAETQGRVSIEYR